MKNVLSSPCNYYYQAFASGEKVGKEFLLILGLIYWNSSMLSIDLSIFMINFYACPTALFATTDLQSLTLLHFNNPVT